jgi:hypothetical protein
MAPKPRETTITRFDPRLGDSSRSVLWAVLGVASLLLFGIFCLAAPSSLASRTLTDTAVTEPTPVAQVDEAPAAAPVPAVTVDDDSAEFEAVEVPAEAEAEAAAVEAPSPAVTEVEYPPLEIAPRPVTVALPIASDAPADVYDGTHRLGKTPLTAHLSPGAHSLRFRANGIETTKKITLRAGQTPETFTLGASTVTIDAPEGVQLSLDGRSLGRAPLKPLTIFEGTHELKVQGEKSAWTETVEVPAGSHVEYTVRF